MELKDFEITEDKLNGWIVEDEILNHWNFNNTLNYERWYGKTKVSTNANTVTEEIMNTVLKMLT